MKEVRGGEEGLSCLSDAYMTDIFVHTHGTVHQKLSLNKPDNIKKKKTTLCSSAQATPQIRIIRISEMELRHQYFLKASQVQPRLTTTNLKRTEV